MVARFLESKLLDSKIVMSQVQDLQVVMHDIHSEGMNQSETFQVAAMIEKLPPSWVDFKNYLKHKRKDMTVEDLIVRLRIEEDNKLALKNTYSNGSSKANVVETGQSSKNKSGKADGKSKSKGKFDNPKLLSANSQSKRPHVKHTWLMMMIWNLWLWFPILIP